MHFEENQLSPSSIGISPLPTPHPNRFQPILVRAFTRSYPGFTLDMGRSLGFGSNPRYYAALLGLAFASAPYLRYLTSQRKLTRRIIMQKARSHTF